MLGIFTKENAIEYLVSVKYPKALLYQGNIHTYIPTGIESTPYQMPDEELARRTQGKVLFEESEAYRNSLNAMNDNEVGLLYNEISAEEREKEEEKKKIEQEEKLKRLQEQDEVLFGKPQMVADFSYWSKMSSWSAEGFVTLSFGKNPDVLIWKNIKNYEESPFIREYSKLMILTYSAVHNNRLREYAPPIDFVNWAKHHDIDFPEELERLVKKYSGHIDWQSSYKQAAAKVIELQGQLAQNSKTATKEAEKPLHKKERDSIYKILACALADNYGCDEVKKGNVKANEILNDLLAKHGVELDEDTIRKHLKKAAEYLP